MNLGSDGYNKTATDRHDKFKMVHKRWREFYDYEGSKNLKDSIKMHLYSKAVGTDCFLFRGRLMS